MESFLILLLIAFCLYMLVGSSRGSFTRSDWNAFEKAQRMREELKKAEKLVGPAKTEPDHTYTLTIKDKAPEEKKPD